MFGSRVRASRRGVLRVPAGFYATREWKDPISCSDNDMLGELVTPTAVFVGVTRSERSRNCLIMPSDKLDSGVFGTLHVMFCFRRLRDSVLVTRGTFYKQWLESTCPLALAPTPDPNPPTQPLDHILSSRTAPAPWWHLHRRGMCKHQARPWHRCLTADGVPTGWSPRWPRPTPT